MQQAGENASPEKALSFHNNTPLRPALEILCNYALNQSEIINTLPKGDADYAISVS
jgi:hypothetical protein